MKATAERPESLLNLTGSTRYVDDIPTPASLLHAVPVGSTSARGHLLRVEIEAALAVDPSVRVLLARDVPGENQLGLVADDEPLLADGEWDYKAQVVALVLAKDRRTARKAASRVKVSGQDLPPVLDPRIAFANGDLILKPMHQEAGDVEAAFRTAKWIAEGRCESDGQEHVYLETQSAIAYPEEGGRMRVISSTQSPSGTQRAVARVLGVPVSFVEVEAGRLGGGFGGKEDQASPWAALAAVGARVSGLPVKLVLSRGDDMRMTGKRHPYSSDFKLAMDAEGHITGYQATYYQNSGAAADLSAAILSRTLFHSVGAYKVPAVKVDGYMCRTNLPPFTAYRGFGAPQGFFAMEAAIMKASELSGIPVHEIQARNLLTEGTISHYGMPMNDCRAERTWDRLVDSCDYSNLQKEIAAFNKANRLKKRGSWIQPVCFGISFTKLMMNQGGALVHVYTDGSVSVATGGVEMGQGMNRKILVAAARTLGVPEDRVSVEKTRTSTVANTMPTAASTGADINGMAALIACQEIRDRLLAFAATLPEAGMQAAGLPETGSQKAGDRLSLKDGVLLRDGQPTGLDWNGLVDKAHVARIDLSAHGFYATPGLVYDFRTQRGTPFAYHVYGAALVVMELDVVRATLKVERAHIIHDGGVSIDPLVDLGQIEGGLAQGLGWSLLEELRFGADGSLLTDTLSTYKLPDLRFMDFPLKVEFLDNADNPKAILGSKAVGEPPFVYGIAAYFAAMEALKAARAGAGFYDLPLTAEKALDFLVGRR